MEKLTSGPKWQLVVVVCALAPWRGMSSWLSFHPTRVAHEARAGGGVIPHRLLSFHPWPTLQAVAHEARGG
jgi:hypothetical protein